MLADKLEIAILWPYEQFGRFRPLNALADQNLLIKDLKKNAKCHNKILSWEFRQFDVGLAH